MLPILLATGLVNVGTNTYLNKVTIDGGNPEPKLFGYDARNLMMGGGVLMALLGTPLLAAVGMGMAAAAWNNKDTVNRVVSGLQLMMEAERTKADTNARLKAEGKLIDVKPDAVPAPPMGSPYAPSPIPDPPPALAPSPIVPSVSNLVLPDMNKWSPYGYSLFTSPGKP